MLSGFARGEMDPPVPAPRHKRKLITNEDSKHLTNEQNMGETEQTKSILPPPRRKKLHVLQETNTLLLALELQEREIALLKELDEKQDIRVINLLNNNTLSRVEEENEILKISKENQNIVNKTLTDSSTNNLIIENDGVSTNFSSDEKVVALDQPSLKIDGSFSNNCDHLGENGFVENQIEHRVLEKLLENLEPDYCYVKSPGDITGQTKKDEDRVNSSISENSATIVGVFYKPEYIALNQEINDNSKSQDIGNGPNTVFGLDSKIDNGIKTSANVPIYEEKITNNRSSIKDSEEDDSGVYFSDTKSPPHREISFNNNVEETAKSTSTLEVEPAFYKHISCNISDTFDNKSSEDLGPQSYSKVLDYFEAKTVNSFREEIVNRFALCNEQINKNRAVEDWLDGREMESANSRLTAYLRNMLEVESDGTISSLSGARSPYQLSAVEEDEGSVASGFVETPVEACSFAVPSSSKSLSTSDVHSVANTVDVNNVNKDCIKVRPTQDKSTFYEVYEAITFSDQVSSDKNEFLDDSCSSLNKVNNYNFQMEEIEDLDSLSNSYYGAENPKKIGISVNVPISPALKSGVVNTLIAYFENIVKQDITNLNCDISCTDSEGHEAENFHDTEENEIIYDKIYDNFETSIEYENAMDKNCVDNKTYVVLENQQIDDVDNMVLSDNLKLSEDCKDVPVNTVNQKSSYLFTNKPIKETCVSVHQPNDQNFSVVDSLVNEKTQSQYFQENLELFQNENDFLSVQQQITENNNSHPQTEISVNEMLLDQINDWDGCQNDINNDSEIFEKLNDEIENYIPDFLERDEEFPMEMKPESVEDCKLVGTELKKSIKSESHKFKPTTIPVVILTEADSRASPVGSIELYLSRSPTTTEDNHSENVFQETETVTVIPDEEVCQRGESLLKDSVEVVLEKNWGSIGLKIRGDKDGVVVSDVLAGGVADQSGLVFKGFVDIKTIREEKEIFC